MHVFISEFEYRKTNLYDVRYSLKNSNQSTNRSLLNLVMIFCNEKCKFLVNICMG